jgi:hypothetical protein
VRCFFSSIFFLFKPMNIFINMVRFFFKHGRILTSNTDQVCYSSKLVAGWHKTLEEAPLLAHFNVHCWQFHAFLPSLSRAFANVFHFILKCVRVLHQLIQSTMISFLILGPISNRAELGCHLFLIFLFLLP